MDSQGQIHSPGPVEVRVGNTTDHGIEVEGLHPALPGTNRTKLDMKQPY